jgi:hypothetical protein
MKALENFVIDKETFESYFNEGVTLTDTEWATVIEEIDGRAANYVDELIPLIIDDFREGLI